MGSMAAPPPNGQQQNPTVANMAQRNLVIKNSVPREQVIFSQTIAPTTNSQLNISPRYVGLCKRFTVEILGTINNTGTVNINLDTRGLANILSQVTFIDLNNNTRIQTTGLHLALLADAKRHRPYAGTYQANTANGNNLSKSMNVNPATWGVYQAPAIIAAGESGTFRMVYEVPLAYTDTDLRGAVWLGQVNATANLQINFNPNILVIAPGDSLFAVYNGGAGAAASLGSCTVTVYQEYLDQLPTYANGLPVLPDLDMSTIYELKNTRFTGIPSGSDYPISYANFRSFVSTFIAYNSTGTYAGLLTGQDLNYLAVQTANFTKLWQTDPLMVAQNSREVLTMDQPPGIYYLPTRDKPISTSQYGNVEAILNPSAGGALAYAEVMWEDFALQNILTQAASLPAGG